MALDLCTAPATDNLGLRPKRFASATDGVSLAPALARDQVSARSAFGPPSFARVKLTDHQRSGRRASRTRRKGEPWDPREGTGYAGQATANRCRARRRSRKFAITFL